MKRGDVVIATGPGFGGKPRPYVVFQADDYAALNTLILLPVSSTLADPPSLLRVRLEPNEANGLRAPSEVMTDIPVTTRRDRVHQTIGHLSPAEMTRIGQAVLLVMGFGG